ncbi:SDR family NAD(P)-dependent oxidoreductase [Yinghuangia sp. ASG 101]|uniref:SDR family NAD(P)-dependent oxidoreductase n=1 Tax=Yinghuangia sp. ASG 101 TaxID=2896848 RepID=UPI001E5B6AD9|nr:SDR family NAD(P)-dependent oxidoreductase [Yinghuangia sp. ASG 101]UGQ11328.1 SDR family NAD(P)-dependent oxidoreductase [Yinghuangia sp. ASG 101]
MKTALITGATDGLGRHVAVRLARAGTRVVVHGRDAGKAERVREEIAQAGGPDPVVVVADLADLRAVDVLGDEVTDHIPRLDVLVNNAGVGFGAPGAGREVSRDGIELRFAVNYLAGHLLTRKLMPLLTRSAPARIVNVASLGQAPLDFADLQTEHGYDGRVAYCRGKLAQIMDTFDVADELRDQAVTANALHPATFMATTMVREAGGTPMNTVETGGDALIRLVDDPSLNDVTGRFFDVRRDAKAEAQAYDPDARRRLREAADALIAAALRG